jgi:hypothetical protein
MVGMVGVAYPGTYPESASLLVALEGMTIFPGRAIKPIEARVGEWGNDVDRGAERKIRQFLSITGSFLALQGQSGDQHDQVCILRALAVGGARRRLFDFIPTGIDGGSQGLNCLIIAGCSDGSRP